LKKNCKGRNCCQEEEVKDGSFELGAVKNRSLITQNAGVMYKEEADQAQQQQHTYTH
jgi:hypothetical protein